MTPWAFAAQNTVALFVLHALWQVPLLAAAAWLAVRLGKPPAKAAYWISVATLAGSVVLPCVSTEVAKRAEANARRGALVSVAAGEYAGELPAFHRESAWLQLLHRHVRRQGGLRPFVLQVPRRASALLATVCIVPVALFAMRLLLAWVRARRLIRRASGSPAPEALAAELRTCCEHRGVEPPAFLLSLDVSGPALAGVWRPVLLLPALAPGAFSAAELQAVLAHEVAHLRRGDPWQHAVCSVLLLPVCFHPAACWMALRIRQLREMACDAEAAAQMGSAAQYGRALLQVAERAGSSRSRFAGLGLFYLGLGLHGVGLEIFGNEGAMEERMHTILEGNDPGKSRYRVLRLATSVTAAAAAVFAAGMLQVQPALAAEQAAQTTVHAAGETSAPSVPATTSAPVQDGASPAPTGGTRARQQLQHARRELAQAQQRATTDEERKRIATAQDMLATAERQLSSDPAHHLPLSFHAPQVDTPEFQEQVHALTLQAQALANTQLNHLPELESREPLHTLRSIDMEKMQALLDEALKKMHASELAMRRAQTLDSAKLQARLQQQLSLLQSPEMQERLHQAQSIDGAKLHALGEAAQLQARTLQPLGKFHPEPLVALNAQPSIPIALPDGTADQGRPPLRVKASDMAANSTYKKVPVYPAEAKEKKIQGEVLLHALISEEGKVEQLSVVSSPDPLLSRSAVEAVQQWTYKPYLLNGEPVSVDTTITVHYSFAP